jgi:tripartite-type tricarboxylate transporter receptor subunit TctC
MVNAGLKMEHIPFKGAAPARLSVIAGETDFIMDNFGSCRASIADGSLIPLAVTTSEPFEHLPGVPTLTSLGYTMDISTWFGLMAPKATPNAKVQAQYDAIFEAMSNPKLREQLDKAGGGVRFLGPNKFGELIAAEQKRYRDMIQSTGIKVQ